MASEDEVLEKLQSAVDVFNAELARLGDDPMAVPSIRSLRRSLRVSSTVICRRYSAILEYSEPPMRANVVSVGDRGPCLLLDDDREREVALRLVLANRLETSTLDWHRSIAMVLGREGEVLLDEDPSPWQADFLTRDSWHGVRFAYTIGDGGVARVCIHEDRWVL